MEDADAVDRAIGDLDSSPLSHKEKLLLRFVDKVNHRSPEIGPADMDRLHEQGWSDSAIYDAITVCALFNFYNRWIDACGVHPMSEEAHRKFGAGTARNGYVHVEPSSS